MDRIDIMYRVIKVMAYRGYPIVFKGAMLLKHIMDTNQFEGTTRFTQDIDADWVGDKITTGELSLYVNDAIQSIGIDGLEVICVREASQEKSAGYRVNFQGNKLFSFDISMKMNESVTLYTTIDGYNFYGSSKEKIYIDKISALSSPKIFRRCKDLYDLYLLSMLDGYNVNNIVNVLNKSGRNIGDFNAFINDIETLEHAYNQMRGVVNKPKFVHIYSRVRDFCLPFITGKYKVYKNATWQPKNGIWVYD